MYELVIFDWDGTLMDSAQKISNCVRVAAKQTGLPEPTEQQAKSIIGLGLYEAMATLFPQADNAKVNEVVEAYKHHFVNADKTEEGLFDGVAKALTTMEETGAMLAIATGKSRAGLDRVLGKVGLAHHFTVTRCADETRSKPHPQMLLEILEFTSIDPQKTIMVGDTTFDLDMAQNAGVAGLGAGYGVHSQQALEDSKALYVAQSFADLAAWLLNGKLVPAFSES